MAHVRLNLFVKGHPHGSKLRKRQQRKLRPVKPSRANELWYKAELLDYVRKLRAYVRRELLPLLKQLEPYYAPVTTDGMARDMDVTGAVKAQLSRMASRLGGVDDLAKRLSTLATEKNLKSVDERLVASIKESVRVDISGALTKAGPIASAVQEATRANIELITSIPDQYFEKLGKAIMDNLQNGIRYEDLAKEVERIGDVTESRAKLIARDQTSKMNGAFNEARQTSLGIEKYIWQTSGDERVRDDHAKNDGETFRWDKAPLTGHPGEDINCRCVAIPVFDLDAMEASLSDA